MLEHLVGSYIAGPHHRGKKRFLRQLLGLMDGRQIKSKYGVLMRSNSRDATNFFAISGSYQSDYSDVFAEVSQLEPGMAFLDIGANAGLFSLVASGKVGPNGVVVAFEPSLKTFGYLIENAVANGLQNFFAFNAALGDATKIARFSAGSPNHSGIAHLDERGETSVLQIQFDELSRLFDTIIGNRESCLKIDVEGAECQVIDSIKNFIAKPQVKKIIVEIDPKYLARSGFTPEDVYNRLTTVNFVPRRGLGSAKHYNEIFERL
jgi:FkbM family methyltransferase